MCYQSKLVEGLLRMSDFFLTRTISSDSKDLEQLDKICKKEARHKRTCILPWMLISKINAVSFKQCELTMRGLREQPGRWRFAIALSVQWLHGCIHV